MGTNICIFVSWEEGPCSVAIIWEHMQVNIHRMSSENKQPPERRDVPMQERSPEGNPHNFLLVARQKDILHMWQPFKNFIDWWCWCLSSEWLLLGKGLRTKCCNKLSASWPCVQELFFFSLEVVSSSYAPTIDIDVPGLLFFQYWWLEKLFILSSCQSVFQLLCALCIVDKIKQLNKNCLCPET